jgi:hypothetical protein
MLGYLKYTHSNIILTRTKKVNRYEVGERERDIYGERVRERYIERESE